MTSEKYPRMGKIFIMVSRSGVKSKTNFAAAAGLLFSLLLPYPKYRVGVAKTFRVSHPGP